MITFQEAFESIRPDTKPSILLGNGFSRSWRNSIFNYANLLTAADFQGRDTNIRDLFKRCDTYDFEAVMRSLTAAKTVLEAYGNNGALIAMIEQDQKLLKDALISAISTTHPDRPNAVNPEEFTSARLFLSKFKQVFTVNYDLLFYWARNMDALDPKDYSSDDGFRTKCQWQGQGTKQQAHFLHGGLHIFDTGTSIEKHAFSETKESIIDLVRKNLEIGKFPLFVSEPTSQKKKHRIEHNPYLSYCYRALQEVDSTFFIHGHSLDENDKHIFDQIKKSKVNKIFVSIYGDEANEANTRVKANARAYLESTNTKVDFYDAESAPIWR